MTKQSSNPQQYIQGWVEFYKLRFKVTPDVLIPRPETELLVDEVLNRIKNHESRIKGKNILVLDIGTGAGNIAISIAKNLQNYIPTSDVGISIIALDISQKALAVAKQNAYFHNVADHIKFIKSDLLSNYTLNPKLYTLIIVANLPYIPSARIPYLDPSVKDFEPHIALDGGKDGFDLYRKLFEQIIKLKLLPKFIIGEIDYTHGEIAINEAQKYFPEYQVEVKLDLARKQRILLVKYSK